MQPRSLHVAGADGLTLHLLEWSRDGVPLLFVHGFGNEAHIWDELALDLAPHYRTLALDLRGHGDSDWDPQGRYDYENFEADLVAVLDALGAGRAVLIAHSLGGRVCTLFAGAHPDRVAGFVLVDSGPELDRRGTLRITLDVTQKRDPRFTSPAEYETALSIAYPAAGASAVRRMAEHGLRPAADGRYALKMDPALRGAVGESKGRESPEQRERRLNQALWDALGKIACPTLVVRGAASDILSADVADRMVDEVIPEAKLAVIPQAGHSVMTDNPDAFRDAVGDFVLG